MLLFLPIKAPTKLHTNVKIPMIPAQIQILTLSNANVTPTAKASMLVAKASV